MFIKKMILTKYEYVLDKKNVHLEGTLMPTLSSL